MSQYIKKVVAVLDSTSTFGTSFKSMQDNVALIAASQASLVVSCTLPPNPTEGQLWFDKNILKMKIYINDGDSFQWVQI